MLKTWRNTHGRSMAECARAVGVSVEMWKRIEDGAGLPGAAVLVRIFSLTDGDVTPQDMYRLRLGWLRAQGVLPAPDVHKNSQGVVT